MLINRCMLFIKPIIKLPNNRQFFTWVKLYFLKSNLFNQPYKRVLENHHYIVTWTLVISLNLMLISKHIRTYVTYVSNFRNCNKFRQTWT